jgi:hypothetical protein
MKSRIILVVMMAELTVLGAEPIHSNVIHNYSYVGVRYDYFPDRWGEGADGHGARVEGSYEFRNFVLTVEGAYDWLADDLDIGASGSNWQLLGSVGYVMRFQQNRLNLIPRFKAGRSESTLKVPRFGSISVSDYLLKPSLTISYAVNDRFAFKYGYQYLRVLEFGDNHALFLGPTVAVTRKIGLDAEAFFANDGGFMELLAGVSYHF